MIRRIYIYKKRINKRSFLKLDDKYNFLVCSYNSNWFRVFNYIRIFEYSIIFVLLI